MQGLFTQPIQRHPVVQFQHPVQLDKEIMRRKPPLMFIERWRVAITKLRSRRDIELLDTSFLRNTADRPICKDHEQGDQDGTSPIGDGIDAEIEALGPEHDLWLPARN